MLKENNQESDLLQLAAWVQAGGRWLWGTRNYLSSGQ